MRYSGSVGPVGADALTLGLEGAPWLVGVLGPELVAAAVGGVSERTGGVAERSEPSASEVLEDDASVGVPTDEAACDAGAAACLA